MCDICSAPQTLYLVLASRVYLDERLWWRVAKQKCAVSPCDSHSYVFNLHVFFGCYVYYWVRVAVLLCFKSTEGNEACWSAIGRIVEAESPHTKKNPPNAHISVVWQPLDAGKLIMKTRLRQQQPHWKIAARRKCVAANAALVVFCSRNAQCDYQERLRWGENPH